MPSHSSAASSATVDIHNTSSTIQQSLEDDDNHEKRSSHQHELTVTFSLSSTKRTTVIHRRRIYYLSISIPRRDIYKKTEKTIQPGAFVTPFILSSNILNDEIILFQINSFRKFHECIIRVGRIRRIINSTLLLKLSDSLDLHVFVECTVPPPIAIDNTAYVGIVFKERSRACSKPRLSMCTASECVGLISRLRKDGSWIPILRTADSRFDKLGSVVTLWYEQGQEKDIGLKIDGLCMKPSCRMQRHATTQCSLTYLLSNVGERHSMYLPQGNGHGDDNNTRVGTSITGLFTIVNVTQLQKKRKNGEERPVRLIEFDITIFNKRRQPHDEFVEDNCNQARESLRLFSPVAVPRD